MPPIILLRFVKIKDLIGLKPTYIVDSDRGYLIKDEKSTRQISVNVIV